MLDARALYLCGLAATALLGLLVAPRPPPLVHPSEAQRHEGQDVRLEGLAFGVVGRDGDWRFDLVRDGHAVPVRSLLPVREAAWVAAEGVLLRIGGRLQMLADHAEEAVAPDPQPATLAALAGDPAAFDGRRVTIAGWLEQGRLRDAAGHALATGVGAWPDAGAVRAVGALRYDEACLCHRFHAERAWPA